MATAFERSALARDAGAAASIIGSGFLVLGPILDDRFGAYGLPAMVALCALAALFGWAIRYNIAARDAAPGALGPLVERMETAASWVLAFAYVRSVAYYLNLFGAFGVSLTPADNTFDAKLLTTAMFGLILAVGWTRGFSALERLEQVSVGIKLAVIAGLLVGLAMFFGGKALSGGLVLNPPAVSGWQAVSLLFGLIVTCKVSRPRVISAKPIRRRRASRPCWSPRSYRRRSISPISG